MKKILITAVGPEMAIGKENGLPWRSRNDFSHFVKQTTGFPCLFGSSTFFSLPRYPLKNRLNIILHRNPQEISVKSNENGGWLETDMEKALKFTENYEKVFVCGGARIYKSFLENNLIDEIYLTRISSKDGALEQSIRETPDSFVYFPVDLNEYLKDWQQEKIEYKDIVSENCVCEFSRCFR